MRLCGIWRRSTKTTPLVEYALSNGRAFDGKAMGMGPMSGWRTRRCRSVNGKQTEYRKACGVRLEIFYLADWSSFLRMPEAISLPLHCMTLLDKSLRRARSHGRHRGSALEGFFLVRRSGRWAGRPGNMILGEKVRTRNVWTLYYVEGGVDPEGRKGHPFVSAAGHASGIRRKKCVKTAGGIQREIRNSEWVRAFCKSLGAALGVQPTFIRGCRPTEELLHPGSVVRYAGGSSRMVQAVTDLLYRLGLSAHLQGEDGRIFHYLDLPEKKKKETIPVQKRRDGRFFDRNLEMCPFISGNRDLAA